MPNLHAGRRQTKHRSAEPRGDAERQSALLDEDGTALVIHAAADDYRTDPAGNAGDRIACGIIAP